MGKELERDLGLLSVMAISIGAMVGSGIFILPALAMEMAGSAVVLAYLLAGLLVLPAALSKSEMATAMPQAGGTYVYIERSMGPLLGTIAGIGTWFALSFKGALALVGGAPYLIELVRLPAEAVAIGVAAALVAVNLVGVKQTGRAQVTIVAVMLAAMGWFAIGSVGSVDAVRFSGFSSDATGGGLLAATGFVFVSYAGVTKIASVAEEIEDPGRNIPIGMLGSLGFTTALYVLVVAVLVGAAPTANLAGSKTPVADVAAATMAMPGFYAIVIAAVLALISTANAGLLSSSRYPFAMSRDGLVPPFFQHVSDRFDTPTIAVAVTGAILLGLIFVPIDEIAKLGSAFQILVFVLINVAVVAFRESGADYDPEFRDPLYPWTQAFGVVGGLVLLTQMGTVPMVGAAAIVLVGAAWYLVYARGRVRREGVARDEIRRRVGRRVVERTRAAVDDRSDHEVIVAVTDDMRPERETGLVRVGAEVAAARDGSLTVVRFDEVPDQMPLEPAAERRSPGDDAFERRMIDLSDSLDVPLEYGEIVSHDTRHAVVNFLEDASGDLLLLEGVHGGLRSRLLGNDPNWISRHATCDVLLVDVDPDERYDEVAIVTDRGTFDPLKIQVADVLANRSGATISLVQSVPDDATDELLGAVEDYHAELADLTSVPVRSRIVEGDRVGTAVASADFVILEREHGGFFSNRSYRQVLDAANAPSVVVTPGRGRRPGLLTRLAERAVF